jgi:predicted  nucleic acid-binding Zn-ribbon protein
LNTTLVYFFVGLAACAGALALAIVSLLHVGRLQRELANRLNLLPTLAELKDAEGRLAGVLTELEVLRQRAGEAQQIIAQGEAVKAELTEARRQLELLEPKRVELRTLEERITQSRAAMEQVERELAALRSQRAQFEVDAASLQRRCEQLQKEAQETGASLQSMRAELAVAQAAKAEAERAIQTLNSKLKGLAEERDALAQRVATLAGQLTQASSELAELQRRIAEAKRELDEARSRTQEHHERLEKLKSEISKLGEDRSRVQRDLDNARAKLAEIAPSITPERRFAAVFDQPPLQGETDSEQLTESDAIKRVMKHANACGFVYSDRVLRAFHTSLKIDSKAPLMVLAGISGTGKTQLPRLYADALGIHFLPVAVQPGWDSPQDLLGFFSHLEGRFRPTSLLQALVQMDRHVGDLTENTDGFGPLAERWLEHDCSDQMLLVLLDEMNLARVEYYFSDFLSRLEIRNSPGFGADDPVKRSRASVLLEGGPGSEGIPVFTDHNVLFVGTMNEDESTQSLSDKVVDRANVLRFGTPRKLETAVVQQGGAADLRSKRLAFATWKSWRATVKPESLRVKRLPVLDWIEKLNEALKGVNRPFGHRTAGAIAEYVGQYPDAQRDDAKARHALADQIEQRVMPKLRGLDPQSSESRALFDRLREVVNELGDDALLEAIEKGERAHEGTQFVWFGVDRGAT